eukprot:gene925-biopygen184
MGVTSLPLQEEFYNELNDCGICNNDYEHAQKVWQFFKCNTFKDYHELYLVTDVLLERGIRGGISIVMKRYAETTKRSSIIYKDANNLYGHAMSQDLPTDGFRLLSSEEIQRCDVHQMFGRGDRTKGYIFRVDLEHPPELHDRHADLPLAPERVKVKEGWLSPLQKEMYQNVYNKKFSTTEKPIPTILEKKDYVTHEKCLQQCLDLGLKLTKIHHVIEFNQSNWLKKYIDFNTIKRTNARNDFEKDLFKLMNNAVFGKTTENVRNHRKFDICTRGERLTEWVHSPQFYGVIEVNDDTLIVQGKLKTVHLNKSIYLGFSILDLSKEHMYDFHYNYVKHAFLNAKLCHMDTDSFIYDIPRPLEEVHQIMNESSHPFDFSNYSKEHPNCSTANKKVIGKMRDELEGKVMDEFIVLRPKMYSCKIVGGNSLKKAKGIKKHVVEKPINHQDYQQCLTMHQVFAHEQCNIIPKNQMTYSVRQKQTSLTPFDDKRYILEDGIHSLPYGHHRLQSEE